MNYQANHRDCHQWKAENLELSTTSNEAAKLLDYAIDQMYCHVPDMEMGGPLGAVEKMLEADENFVMAKVMYLGLNGSARLNTKVAETVAMLERIEDCKLNARERLHKSAAINWALENKLEACKIWEEILLQYPKDSMALFFSYYGYIISGQSRMLRDCVARILPWWKKSDFHYAYLLGYHAFGLEQTNMFAEAERVAKESLAMIPNNSWCMHAYSHVFDSTCRSEEGVAFLNQNENLFKADNNSLACHLYWHQSVNCTETGDYSKVLDIYDQSIFPALKKSKSFFNMKDGCQLLQRLEFEGVDVGIDRWNGLYDCYKPFVDSHELAYDDAHLLISFVRSKAARDENMKDTFMESLHDYAQNSQSSNGKVTREFFFPFANGINAYHEGRFEEAVDSMLPVYKDIHRIGGSNAQRDLFYQFVINACMRSPVQKYQTMAGSLLNERKLFRPNSLLTERIISRLNMDH